MYFFTVCRLLGRCREVLEASCVNLCLPVYGELYRWGEELFLSLKGLLLVGPVMCDLVINYQ